MKTSNSLARLAVAAATLALLAGLAQAQGGPGPGPGAGRGAGPGAAAPLAPATGPAPAARGTARWGADYTPGWSLMTEAERNAHRDRLRTMNSYEECVAYMAQHREQMTQRANEQGRQALGTPRYDACAPLKK